MRFNRYIKEQSSCVRCEPNKQHILSEEISDKEIAGFIRYWKSKLKSYGVTEFKLSDHGFKRLNHKRNSPPISIKDLNITLEGFLRKEGNQFKQDVENVKNNVSKKRGKKKNEIPPNNLEFTVKSVSTKVNLAFVLKQDSKQKGTAIVLPMTMMRKKKFTTSKGVEVVVERRMI